MNFADRVKDFTSTTGTGPITLAGGTPAGYQGLSALGGVGTTFLYGIVGGSEWEVGVGVITGANTFSRAPESSSNGGELVNFSAGTKDFFCTLSAAQIAKLSSADIAFTTAVPLTRISGSYMPVTVVTGPLAFSPMAGAVRGAFAFAPLLADGVSSVTFPGFIEHSGSGGYDNRPNILNLVEFFNLGGVDWWSGSGAAVPVAIVSASVVTISLGASSSAVGVPVTVTVSTNNPLTGAQTESVALSANVAGSFAAGPVTLNASTGSVSTTFTPTAAGTVTITGTATGTPALASGTASYTATAADTTAPTLSAPTGASTGTTTASGTVTTDEANGTLFSMASTNATELSSAVIAGGAAQTITGTGGKSAAASGLAPATTYRMHYAHRDAAGNVATNATSSAAFTTAASATVPATMAAPVITAGDGSISIAWVAPSDGGSAILDATFTASTGQTATGATSPVTMAVPNGAAVTVTGKARNVIGSAAVASPASNIVTPAAVVVPAVSLVSRFNTTASSGLYTGALSGQSFGSTISPLAGGVLSKALLDNTDGSFVFRIAALAAPGAGANELHISIGGSDFPVEYGNASFALLCRTTGYGAYTAGASVTVANTLSAAVGDYVKVERLTGNLSVYVSKDGGATFPANQRIVTWAAPTTQLFAGVRFWNAGAIDSLTSTGMGTPIKTAINLTLMAGITEGGTVGAHTYTGNGTVAAYSAGQAAMVDKALTTAKNGSITIPISTIGTGKAAVVSSANATVSAPASTYLGIGSDNPYAAYNNGSANAALSAVTPASLDIMKWMRQGVVTRIAVSKDAGDSFVMTKEFTTGNNTSNNLQVFLTGTTTIGPIVGTGVA